MVTFFDLGAELGTVETEAGAADAAAAADEVEGTDEEPGGAATGWPGCTGDFRPRGVEEGEGVDDGG